MIQQLISVAEKACDLVFDLWVYGHQMKWAAPKVIAHRGAWDRIGCQENTMMAFEKARLVGAYGIEFDVHFTKDDVPVIHHDSSLSRIFKNPGIIQNMTLDELRSVTEEIPTLEEVLRLEDLHFMVEVKTKLSPRQIEVFESCLQGKEPVQDFHLLTLDPDLVFEIGRLPSRCWILVGELKLKPLVDLSLQKKYAGVAGHYLGMSKKLIARLHDGGQKAGVGFVPSRNLFNREWRRKVDWVFTNSTSRLF